MPASTHQTASNIPNKPEGTAHRGRPEGRARPISVFLALEVQGVGRQSRPAKSTRSSGSASPGRELEPNCPLVPAGWTELRTNGNGDAASFSVRFAFSTWPVGL